MSIETPLIDHSSFDGAVLIVGLLVRLSTQKIDNLKPVLAGSEHARSCHQLIVAGSCHTAFRPHTPGLHNLQGQYSRYS